MIESIIAFISGLSPLYLYPLLFVGIIFTGELTLLPAIYISTIGSINLFLLFLVATLAGIAADSFWYHIGTSTKEDRLYSLPYFKKRINEARKFSEFYSKRGVMLSFFTKFIYGTRIISHILSGMYRITYIKFIGATAAGTMIWFFLFYFLIRSINMGISSIKETATRTELLFLTLTALVILINWSTSKYLKKKMLKTL